MDKPLLTLKNKLDISFALFPVLAVIFFIALCYGPNFGTILGFIVTVLMIIFIVTTRVFIYEDHLLTKSWFYNKTIYYSEINSVTGYIPDEHGKIRSTDKPCFNLKNENDKLLRTISLRLFENKEDMDKFEDILKTSNPNIRFNFY